MIKRFSEISQIPWNYWANFSSFFKFVYSGICIEPCARFTKQRNTLNIEPNDVQLKLTNLQFDICDPLSVHQNPSFPLKNNSRIKGAFVF